MRHIWLRTNPALAERPGLRIAGWVRWRKSVKAAQLTREAEKPHRVRFSVTPFF